jgi:tetratricopeptide (TPR) repeat protein
MRQLFERLASRQPLLLVMEDWHWVDQSSIALGEHLIPLASSHAVAFWFVTRADPGQSAGRVRQVAESRDGGVPFHEIALVPLGDAQSGSLVDHLVGHPPETVRAQIVRRTEGNPFFIEEVVRALIADGTLVKGADGTWRLARPFAALVLPETVQGVIAARIDRLEDGVKNVLKLASVIGRSFFLRILKAIAGAGDSVEGALGQLEHAELVRMRQRLPELEYIFRHALVQETAYGSILAERRRVIHRGVAQALEHVFPDRLDEFTNMLAYHYALAEDWEKAQEYLFKAGDHAGRMAADAEALEHYRRAEAAYARVAARELAPLQRATLDRKLGQAFYGVGSYEQAVEHFTRALAHLDIQYPRTRSGVRRSLLKYLAAHFLRRILLGKDHERQHDMDLATAQEISATCRCLAWLDYFVDEERFGLDSMIELYAGDRSGDVLARVRGLGTLGTLLRMLGASGMARRRTDEAHAMAQQGDDPATIAMGALARGWQEFVEGAVDAALRSLRVSAATFRGIGDIRGWAGPSCLIYWLLHRRADLASLEALAREMLEIGRGAGDPHITSWAQNGLGLHGFTVGPLDEAAAHLVAVVERTGRISSFRMQAGTGGLLGRCRLRQGRRAEAAAVRERCLDLIKAKKLSRGVVGRPAQRVRRALPRRRGADLGSGAASRDSRCRARVRHGARLHPKGPPLAARDVASARDPGVALPRSHRCARAMAEGARGRDGLRLSGSGPDRVHLQVLPRLSHCLGSWNTLSRRQPSCLSPHRPVSSEPYLRRLSGMMVIAGDVAINGRASGRSWSRRAYPRGRNGPMPSVRDSPPLCSPMRRPSPPSPRSRSHSG